MMRVAFILMALAAPASATPAAAATLEAGLPPAEAVEAALDGHPAVLAARARLEAARAEARALRAGPHEFEASVSFMRRRIDGEGEYSEYDAALTRAIRLPGKAALDRRMGAAGVRMATDMAEDARHQAAVQLNDLWWDWLGAAAEARVLDAASSTAGAALDAARQRVALRDAAPLEGDQAEIALGTARAAARAAHGRAGAARASLAAQFPALPLPAQAPPLPDPALPPEGLDHLAQLVVERSHEIGAVAAEAERMGARAERARHDRLADPSIGVRGFSERGGEERGVGLLLSVPLGGAHRRARADEAGASANAAQADLAARRHEITALAARDRALAEAALAAWREAGAAAQAAQSAARRMAKGHALGGIDLTDRLYAERQAQEAALAEASARTEALRAIARIRIDSHTLWMHAEDRHEAMPSPTTLAR